LTLVWIAVALILCGRGGGHSGPVRRFVALGAVAAAAAAFAGGDILAQAIVFGAVSVGGVVLVRRPLLGYLQRRHTPEMLSGARR